MWHSVEDMLTRLGVGPMPDEELYSIVSDPIHTVRCAEYVQRNRNIARHLVRDGILRIDSRFEYASPLAEEDYEGKYQYTGAERRDKKSVVGIGRQAVRSASPREIPWYHRVAQYDTPRAPGLGGPIVTTETA